MTLKLTVNSASHYKPLVQEFEERIGYLHLTMEQLRDDTELRLIQGRILELRKLLQLREEVNGRDKE